LSEGGREITQGIGVKSAEIEESLSARAEALTQSLSQLSTQITATLAGKLDEMTGALGGNVDRFRNQVVSPLQTLSNQFESAIDVHGAAIHESIANAANRIGADLSAQRDAFVASLEAAIENLNAALAGRGDEIVSDLAARIEELRTLLTGPAATDFVAQLGQRGAEFSSQITGVSERAAQTFERQTSSLIALLTRRSEDLLAAINASAADSVQSLGALTGQLSSEVEQSGAALRDAVERNAGASVTALTAAGERMRNELSQVLERLGQASFALDRVVDGAGDTLGAIQSDLGEKMDAMQGALGAMAAQVSELDHLSSTTQNASGSLVERLAVYVTALAEVSRDLAAKQQAFDQAVERRHTSLHSLLVDIDAKSQEFDDAASRFAASFEESFNRAQTRAQEISAALTLATKGTALSVVSQFEMIRENAGKERERTTQALQAAYEQANVQLSEVMNDTTDRFRQAVAEVKQMAAEVQRHLDATRQELRRGVFELPEETNEAATAMRRVVSDQIKALRELTAVVTASGADFDVAEPAAAPARLEAARNGSASRNGDSARDERALVGAPVAADPARSLAKPVRPRAPQAAASAPPTAPSTVERGQSGWLSNLLAAASRDEAPSAPFRAGNDAIEGISLDIAKFVDAEAAAEMWDRWRAGDTNAVSRRLYTAQGQQTFDEVRRRFRNDPQFQVSVTRYTQEFERLLAKIGQSDRDGAQSRATLLSDAGKVYTMLAHASGRLG
jgi:phage host-nuclease inhibitor protein Gam